MWGVAFLQSFNCMMMYIGILELQFTRTPALCDETENQATQISIGEDSTAVENPLHDEDENVP